METVTVNVRRAGGVGGVAWAEPDLKVDLERARKLATLLDSQFSIAGIKFGLDAIVGLVPVVGDTLTALAGLYPIWVARRHNLGKTVQARMALNVVADWAAGSIPVIGDLIDVTYKSNLKNLTLLERAAERRGTR
jgi:hypothetical protein